MADAQKTIDLIFNGVDKTGAATLSALNNAKSFTESLQNATQPIADFTVGAVKLEAGLLAAGLAMTVFAVKTAGDFDGAFRQISTIIDASAEDLDGFKAAILDYAKNSTMPLEQITAALGAAIGSGVEWADSLDLISVAEKLAVATRSDLDSTTKVLVSTLNSYGMGIDEASGLSDLFFQIIDDGDISMTDLAASFAKVAPVAKISGVSLQEVGAAIATLTASGIKPAESIEYLRGAIANIISPSGMAKDLAAELGLNFSAAGLKADGLAGLLGKVSTATGGSADKMKILFGDIGGFTAAATLAGPQADKFREAIASMGNATGATAEAFAKMSSSLDASTAKVGNAFTTMMVAIGSPLLDEFGGVANAIAAIFNALGDSVKTGGLKEIVDYIEGLFGDLQQSLATVAKNLPAALAAADFSGFKAGIDAVIGAFKTLFGNIDLSTVDGLTKAINVAGAAFLGLSSFTAGVIESFKPLFDWLVKVGSGLEKIDPETFKFAGNLAGVATQANLLAKGLSDLLPAFEALIDILLLRQGIGLVKAFANFGGAMPGVAAGLQAAGVAFAAYWASDKVVKLVDALLQWKTANDKLNESQEQTAEIQAKALPTLEQFSKTTGIAVKSIDEASKLVDSGAVVWSSAANGWVKAGDALADVGAAAEGVVNPFEKSNEAMLNAFAASEKAAGGTGKLATAQKDVATYALQMVPVYDKLTGAITGYEQQLVKTEGGTVKLGTATDKAGGSLSKISEETKKAAEEQKKWNEEIAKMAFQEKLALIDSQTKITTANIEADARKTVAAFESISASITSTGDVLGTLFGLFKDFGSMGFSEQWAIQEQIDTENKLRQDAFKLQKELTEAQIKLMNAQADALINGEGMITINGDGLAPHLEAFMWEVLRAIQVKVNQDGLKMLLGV